MKDVKVFGIGFQKTGTSSLGKALEVLGYRVGGYNDFRSMADDPDLTMEMVIEHAHAMVERYDAMKDTPWPILYKEMDQAYPGSKFIHVVRSTESWMRSARRDFGTHPNFMHRLIYGCDFPAGNEDVWVARYEQHNREVLEYFHGRDSDFISLDLNKGEVCFERICAFLGEPVPDVDWPHVNQRADKKRRMFVAKVLRKIGVGK